ncbi:hypothetical protein E3E12_00915 [Formicincola oecophyllae]|uniref:Toprim domain-containing protein n=1 Tax=Formicincola oecophyllae TaxID=2558361 RepID=A0A4Y6U746_9PROT|nr:hypothetical protein [Formicincola oecophyllae]QDH12994.1 hypothetical protein E3E12_00915 [Formicincola oecophyllae]
MWHLTKVERFHLYRDADSHPLYATLCARHPDGRKEFRWMCFGRLKSGEAPRWHYKAPPEPRPLYGLHELALRPSAPVLVVEGEQTAETLHLDPDFPYVAVTSPGGAANPHKADWSPLMGCNVTIWPDNDPPGLDYAERVKCLCWKAGALSVAVVNVEGLPTKWDLADSLSAPEFQKGLEVTP